MVSFDLSFDCCVASEIAMVVAARGTSFVVAYSALAAESEEETEKFRNLQPLKKLSVGKDRIISTQRRLLRRACLSVHSGTKPTGE